MTGALIRTVDLQRDYRKGGVTVSALRGVTLEIGRGEFVAVTGPSGSGKTTLMNVLGLLDQPSAGFYQFEGLDAGRLGHDARAGLRSGRIGFIFQNFNLLPRNTALKNVELPLVYARRPRKERRRRAEEALDLVGLASRLHHLPNQLSGGEQQRVAIARALVNDPSLLLADEPTGALDSATGHNVMRLLQSLNRDGRTIVLVTHEADVAREARRSITMQDGRVAGDSTVRTVDSAQARPPSTVLGGAGVGDTTAGAST